MTQEDSGENRSLLSSRERAVDKHTDDKSHFKVDNGVIDDDGDEDDNEELADSMKLLKNTFFDDILLAVYEARFAAPLVALLGIIIAYQITIAPYKVQIVKDGPPLIEDISLVRPLLSEAEMAVIQDHTLRAETHFIMKTNRNLQDENIYGSFGSSENDGYRLRFFKDAGRGEHTYPPDFFYEGVTFGLTTENPHNVQFISMDSKMRLKDLKHDLLSMNPKPTSIVKRETYLNGTDFSESGYAVYFSYDDLKKQGKFSTDILHPWKRVAEDVLTIARKYRQIYITTWYPNKFGAKPTDKKTPHRHTSLLKQIVPTRTGLNRLKSITPVWLAVNIDVDEGILGIPNKRY